MTTKKSECTTNDSERRPSRKPIRGRIMPWEPPYDEKLDAHHIPLFDHRECGRCFRPMTARHRKSGYPIHAPVSYVEPSDFFVMDWLTDRWPDEFEVLFYKALSTSPETTANELANKLSATPDGRDLLAKSVRSVARAEQSRWGRVEFYPDSDHITLLLDPTTGKRYG